MNSPAPSRTRLYDADDLEGVLRAMARQATACLPPSQAALIGIQRRGEPLARRLQEHIQQLTGQPPLPLYPIKVKRYADDLTLLHAHTQLIENPSLDTLNLAETTLLVVDDVLYEGHSLLRTCAYLAQLGARRVLSAVLVDRHVCRQPVHADIVGVHLQVAAQDIIECHVPPYEADFCIEVVRHGQAHSTATVSRQVSA
ncbi:MULTISPECIES: bifunctional pyr operon transcriptional regulator/uracil phosphoribosyltransferase PyrR [Pseudomonas]|uniref:Bifunctional protein PyrR n=1 Tax=Pseudomonas putida TaxID=303 RepID=A0A1B2F2Z7_PSEPU|nr:MULTISPECIES: phosphoribosyltransferase family protein [Pseudomonas]ANY86586.1 Bifunctional protein PyrR [Pseudomonas putida]MCL8305124.1 phosphoribosyltransferase [Pseudomonas putida]